MFCAAKDGIPIHQKANVIYIVTSPGCNEDYLGKTDRNLVTRLNEHASREDQPMHHHLSKFEHFHILLIYLDYQTLMLQHQRSVTNNTLLRLLFLTFVFLTPALTGPNCYFQKHCTSKMLHLKLMMA